MALAKINQISGSAVYVPGDDIDTDRIIPARFMKCVTFDGLGEYLFHDVRFDDQGNKKDHSLNDERFHRIINHAFRQKLRLWKFPRTRPAISLPGGLSSNYRGQFCRNFLWKLN